MGGEESKGERRGVKEADRPACLVNVDGTGRHRSSCRWWYRTGIVAVRGTVVGAAAAIDEGGGAAAAARIPGWRVQETAVGARRLLAEMVNGEVGGGPGRGRRRHTNDIRGRRWRM